MAIDITASSILGNARISGSWGVPIGFVHIPEEDVTFYVGYYNPDSSDPADQGILGADAVISGSFHGQVWGLLAVLQAAGSISASANFGTLLGSLGYVTDPKVYANSLLGADASLTADFYIQYLRNNLVGWSKIGDTRIHLDESNEAGYHYLPGVASSLVHRILSLKEKYPVIYSASGIHIMLPVGSPFATFGFKRLSLLGSLGPGAVCGSDTIHYFIDTEYTLNAVEHKVDAERPTVTSLGYSEFMQALSPNNEEIVMHYDKINERAYISSSVGGFVLTTSGLGGGYANLSMADGQIFASPSVISSPSQEFCTDILDMQYRGIKTVTEIMIGTALDQTLMAAVDYRYDKSLPFVTSVFKPVNKEGVVFPIVSGVEFRIRFKTLTYDDFSIDYLTVRFKYSDKRFNRGQWAIPGGTQQ